MKVKLTPTVIKGLAPGEWGDQDTRGLSLIVDARGNCRWKFRFSMDYRATEMGFGSFPVVSLADAREKALEAHRMIAKGENPKQVKDRAKAERRAAQQKKTTFRHACSRYLAEHGAGWKNPVHAQQWVDTLDRACDTIGSKPVSEIDKQDVLSVIRPMWGSTPETASRLRGRIEQVLDFSAFHGWRDENLPNPARWKGNLEKAGLPERPEVKHHPEMAWLSIPQFMAELSAETGSTAAALWFTILTAARTGEVIGARWSEIDFENKLWIVPASRMKAGREHRVPLMPRVAAMLWMRRAQMPDAEFIFPGDSGRGGISNMTMRKLLQQKLRRPNLTVHGFRSSFSTWCAETGQSAELREAALAHASTNKTAAAYQRGDMLARRRALMEEWAAFCLSRASANADQEAA